MGSLHERNPSVWVGTSPATSYPALADDTTVDVAVVGGGITGLTTALLLKQGGARVAVIEAGRVASGTTGYTTAKVTALHGLVYAQLVAEHGEETARRYADANAAAVEQVASLVDRLGIECDFERRAAFTYTTDPGQRADIEAETEAATRLGLPATLVGATDLPYPVEVAVRLDHQAQLHPRRYCVGLAEAVDGDGSPRLRDDPGARRRRARGRRASRPLHGPHRPRRRGGRPGRAGDAAALRRPRGVLRQGPSHALLRHGRPGRRRRPPGHVPGRRLPHPVDPARAPRRRARPGPRRAEPQGGPGRRHQPVLRRARAVGPRQLRHPLGGLPVVGPGLRARRHGALRGALTPQRAPPRGHRLQEVGPEQRNGGGRDARRLHPRPTQPVGRGLRRRPGGRRRVGQGVRLREPERGQALRQ
jgi:hypothetical protein